MAPARKVELSKRQLFDHVNYHPHPGQWPIHESKARRRVVATGSRFGKTTTAKYEVAAALLAPCQSSRGWIVAPTLDVSQRIFLQVADLFKTYFKARVKLLDLRTRRLVVINLGGGTSEVRAMTADTPSALLGESVSWMVVDEAASLRAEIWERYLAPRLIDTRGWSLLLSVPKGPGWFYDAFRQGQRNRDPDAQSWTGPSSLNPHVSAEVIEAERTRLSPEAFREQFLGEFTGVLGEPCWTCNGPDPSVPGVIVIQGDLVLPRCPECGQVVDAQGHTRESRFPDGTPVLTIIQCYPRRRAPPKLPIEEGPEDPRPTRLAMDLADVEEDDDDAPREL
jgi:hypothetical protein